MKFNPTHILTTEYGYTKQVEVTPDGLIFDEYERDYHLGCHYNLINGKVFSVTSLGTRKEVPARLTKI